MLAFSMSLIPRFIALIAELAFTITFHVRTSYFFLYRLMTSRTLPCIIFNPTSISLLRVEKIIPFLNVLARSRFMRLLEAFEAVQLTTRTLHQAHLLHTLLWTEERAFIVWAVTNILVLNSIVYQDFSSIQLA